MSHPFETFADRHPAATGGMLTVAHLGVLTVPAATILAAITGRTGLTIVGVFAGIGLYATGYAAAALRYRHRTRQQIAQAREDAAQSRRDPLTRLPNRAAADEMLADATRVGAPMTVALIDVDGLKMVNSSIGHAGGDQYLLAVARRLARAVPDGGVLVRQGGDEFALLAPGVDPQQLAVDIGAALAGPAVIAGYRLQPRASVGIAATDPAGVSGANHARARADSAMYTAKREGGNRILVFDPDRDPEPLPDGTRPAALLRTIRPTSATDSCRRDLARDLLADLRRVDRQLKINETAQRDAVAATGSTLSDVHGIAVVLSAKILGYVGDITRFPTADHFASYTGTSPLDPPAGGRSTRRSTEWRWMSASFPPAAGSTPPRRTPRRRRGCSRTNRTIRAARTSRRT
jgi:diguanylate cyclase (GGDEF)-like protein